MKFNHYHTMLFRPSTRLILRFGVRLQSGVPSARVKWFYATDIANTKPDWYGYTKEKDAANFAAFSDFDGERLERKYQSLSPGASAKPIEPVTTEPKNSVSKSSIVEVNDDKLFQVDINTLELSPVYWEGPTYEVRRGTWFSTSGIPVSKELTEVIEKGYLERKPYLYKETKGDFLSKETIAKFNQIRKQEAKPDFGDQIKLEEHADVLDLKNGKYILFFNAQDGVMFSSTMNNFQLGVIRNFGPNASLISVDYVRRGYSEKLGMTLADKLPSNPLPNMADLISKEVPSLINLDVGEKKENDIPNEESEKASEITQESAFVSDFGKEVGDREIEHLVLCIHGIGQILGHKYESVNFTHSINVLRNTMREVYRESSSFHKFAGADKHNNKIQVLPISWRHKIDFHPQEPFEQYDADGKYRLPTLSQINVDGVKPLRNVLGDVVLDILLYYEPLYVNKIFETVVTEVNRVYNLYMERNPNFKGKVHVMGHSLGSVISFDILCNQSRDKTGDTEVDMTLDFPVENLFCVGSPVGVFKLLEQKNIVGKSLAGDDFDEKLALSPNCKNLYNIFHPCDPVGYRMEPLISPDFAKFKPEPVPFAIKGINTQFKELATLGGEITEKFARASSWFTSDTPKKQNDKTVDEKIESENALGDILRSLSRSEKAPPKAKSSGSTGSLDYDDLKKLTALNRTGRVDYALPMGVFDISLVSAISAHVSYFEDKDTAGFIMKEVLASTADDIKSKKVVLY